MKKIAIIPLFLAIYSYSQYTLCQDSIVENDGSTSNFSMVTISDPQLFWTENYLDDDLNEALSIKFNNFTVDVVNDIVRSTPDANWQGIIVNGDLTAFGHGNELQAYEDFINQFSLPIYPGLGNHDYANNVDNCGDNGCATDMVRYLIDQVKNQVPYSTLKRFDYVRQNHPGPGEDVFKGSMSYSWNVGKVHFVQLNNYPEYKASWESSNGDNGSIMRIKDSMKWLRDDLSRAIHEDGAETIILNMHDYGDHWAPSNNSEFRDILANYPVTAIFAGHTHETSGASISGVPVYRTGASHKAEFTLLNFSNEQMHVTVYDAEPLYEDDIIDGTEDYPTPVEYDVTLRHMDIADVPNYRRPEVVFYENGSSENINNPDDLSCYFSDFEYPETQKATIRNEECFNDDAGSVELKNVPADTVIKVYDDPDGSMEDDYSIIKVLDDIEGNYLINSLEKDFNDSKISMINNHNNGLNGKVSRFEVYPPGTYQHQPLFVFYEGDNGDENIVCTLPGNAGSVKFDNNKAPYYCDNDEARSVELIDIPKGTVLELTDDPGGDHDHDYAIITVQKDILTSHLVYAFDYSYNDGVVNVDFHKKDDGDLEGKVSRAKIFMGPY